MSSRELEEKMELEHDKKLAVALGISLEELSELDYEIHANESDEGLVYEHAVHISESSNPEVVSKIEGLSLGNYVYLQPDKLESDPYLEELAWDIISSEQYENFQKSINNAKALIGNPPISEDVFYFYVMLHPHIVASIEAFLSSTFIHSVTGSEELIRKVVETEPRFKNQKISVSEIYKMREGIKNTVGAHLKGIIFHKIKIAASLYKSVLGIDFGDIKWLSDAITLRHDCTHRAGLDKQGQRINISESSIRALIEKSEAFCHRINSEIFCKTKL